MTTAPARSTTDVGRRRRTVADRLDEPVADEHPAVRVLGAGIVHRHDPAVLQEHRHRRVRPYPGGAGSPRSRLHIVGPRAFHCIGEEFHEEPEVHARRAGRVPRASLQRWRRRWRRRSRARRSRRRSRSPGSIRARTTTAAGRPAHDAGRKYAEKVLGAKIQTTYKDKAFSNAQVPAIGRGPRARRVPDDLRDVVRRARARRQRPALREVPEGAVRAGDGHADQEEPVRVLRRRRGHDLPLRHGRRRRHRRRA